MEFLSSSRTSQFRCKFGRVVKALALGANLERGTGSNPVTCTFFLGSDSLVVMTSALHAEGREFDPRSEQDFWRRAVMHSFFSLSEAESLEKKR
jgi:hypothetical protein